MITSNFDSLNTFFEGDSRVLKEVDESHLLCRLKPTVFSFVDQGPVTSIGIDKVRTELNALFCKELEVAGIKTSTLKTENDLIWMSKEKVPPIEVIVKGALVGSPKHQYVGLDKTITRDGGKLLAGEHHTPYVRFDWRNPLPKEDACMPEELANRFIDVEKAKETALSAFARLRAFCLRHDLDLLDICFFMNEAGDTICAEISTDNTRIEYIGKDQAIAAVVNSRGKELATNRAKRALSLLKQPILRYPKVIVSGGFCTGKTSLIAMLQDKLGIPKLIDHTTRLKRKGEKEGFPYHFITRELFEENVKADRYHEWVEFNGNYYGVPKEQVFEAESWALDILSESWKDYQGKVPGVISVFLESPQDKVLIERARIRGDTEEKIQERLASAKKESAAGFDVVIEASADLEEKFAILQRILRGGLS